MANPIHSASVVKGHAIKRMGPETNAELRILWSKPPEGWCWCVAWEVPTWDGWGKRTAEQNCELREALWARGEYSGYVFYLENEPIGWCRVGPSSTWPKFCRERRVPPSESVFAFTCFGILPDYRRKGHLGKFLLLVLEDLAARNVTKVIVAPKRLTGAQPDGQLWNGPARLFERVGFTVQREDENFTIMELSIPKPPHL